MKFIDFFAGIGGIRLGLEQSGHVCVGFCEFDKFARQSYKAIHNTEGEWENHDIRTVKPYELPEADLWTFGFPCQDLSIAGKQKGLQAGERSGLFYEIMRLLAGRRQEDRPQWLLVENVKNLLSIGNGFDFARLLCEVGGYGYSLQWDTLNSKNFGVPQNRERVFIVGCLGNISGREVFPLRGADEQNPCKLQELTSGQAQALRCYDPVGGVSRCLNSGAGGMGAKTGLYVINACEDMRNIKTLKANYSKVSAANFISDTGYGASGVCEVKEKLVPIKVSKPYGTERKDMGIKSIGEKEINCLQAHYAKGLSDGDIAVCAVLTPDREEKHQNGRRMKEDGEPMFTLTAQDRHGIAIKEATKQGYTFANVGDSVNLAQPTSETRRGRVGKGVSNTLTCSDQMGVVVENSIQVLGNYSSSGHESSRVVHPSGIAPTVKENHGTVTATIVDDQGRKNKKLEHKDTCPTLRAQSHGNEPKVIEGNVRIRKLTPKECWRLQGFLDEYFDKAKAAGVSDSQLYKQAGNAVTVNVARAIGEKLKEIEEKSR